LFEFKEDDPALAGLTTVIHYVFRGLKFEPDTEIGQKRAFFKGFYFRPIKAANLPVVPSPL
jgi:hypothetical protein